MCFFDRFLIDFKNLIFYFFFLLLLPYLLCKSFNASSKVGSFGAFFTSCFLSPLDFVRFS